MLKDWHYRTHNKDLLNLEENKFDNTEELSMKAKVLRNTQIRSMHEMGAQELRIAEVSVQKLRENHETTKKLTSQLQQISRTNEFPMSDSGDFQDVDIK